MKMSQKLIIVVAGLSLGACSMFEGQNTFMTYQDLQDKVRKHDEQWQSVQPKLERLDKLEAELATLKQKNGMPADRAVTSTMATSKATMLTTDESMAAPNVAPAVIPAPVIEARVTNEMASAPMAATTLEAVATEGSMSNSQLAMTASESNVMQEPKKMTPMSTVYGVQVASYSNRDEAVRGWRILQKKSPTMFDGLVPQVNEKEVKGRTMYQLKVGPFVDKTYSSKFCSTLKEQGTDCLVTKYNGDAF